MIVINLKVVLIFGPESFGVYGWPFQQFSIDFFTIFVEWTQNFNVVFKDCADSFDILDKLMIFDVTLQQSIDNLKKFIVNHKFETSIISLDVFENHKWDSGDFLSADLL